MTQSDELRGPIFYPANLLASLLVLALMALAYWKFPAPTFQIGWGTARSLTRRGVGLHVRAATHSSYSWSGGPARFLGRTGTPRLGSGCSEWWRIRSADRLCDALKIGIASICGRARYCSDSVKGAGPDPRRFGLRLCGVADDRCLSREDRGRLAAGVGAFAGALIHIGAGAFVVAWLVAYALYLSPAWVLRGRGVGWTLSALGVSAGAIAVSLIFRFSTAIEFNLQDFGVDTSAEAVGGVQKYVFWICLGVGVLISRGSSYRRPRGARKFGYAYAIVLGALILPGLYVLCATLVIQ